MEMYILYTDLYPHPHPLSHEEHKIEEHVLYTKGGNYRPLVRGGDKKPPIPLVWYASSLETFSNILS